MVHIVGLENHFFQFVGLNNKELPERLREYVLKFVEDNHIDLIAEEFVKDPNDFCCKEIVCEKIANDSNDTMKHKFVELSLSERAKKDIKSEDHKSRENHWLDCIEEDLKAGSEILFVCGMKHRKCFRKLLKAKGYHASVVKILRTE